MKTKQTLLLIVLAINYIVANAQDNWVPRGKTLFGDVKIIEREREKEDEETIKPGYKTLNAYINIVDNNNKDDEDGISIKIKNEEIYYSYLGTTDRMFEWEGKWFMTYKSKDNDFSVFELDKFALHTDKTLSELIDSKKGVIIMEHYYKEKEVIWIIYLENKENKLLKAIRETNVAGEETYSRN
jgi:hypothetical protein